MITADADAVALPGPRARRALAGDVRGAGGLAGAGCEAQGDVPRRQRGWRRVPARRPQLHPALHRGNPDRPHRPDLLRLRGPSRRAGQRRVEPAPANRRPRAGGA